MDQKPMIMLNGTDEEATRQRTKDILAQRVEASLDLEFAKKKAKKPIKKASIKFEEKKHPRGPDGKFAKNSGSKTSKSKGGGGAAAPKEMRTLADIAGFKDNLPIKVSKKKGEGTVYEVKLKNGQTVKVIDPDGTAPPEVAQKVISALAARQQESGIKPPREVIFERPDPDSDSELERMLANAYGWVEPDIRHKPDFEASGFNLPDEGYGKDHQIHLNLRILESPDFTQYYRDSSAQEDPALRAEGIPGWKMESAAYSNGYNYNLSHEFGHTISMSNDRLGSALSLYDEMQNYPLKYNRYMSEYGQSNYVEAYAEAYAEWHMSEGRTSNPIAKLYAEHERWMKPIPIPRPAYSRTRAVPSILTIDYPRMVSLATEKINSGAPIIIDYDDGSTHANHLNMPKVEATEAERKSAKEVVAKFLG